MAAGPPARWPRVAPGGADIPRNESDPDMRLPCPLCGARDIREFDYMGDAIALQRPAPDAGAEAWDDYLHNRDNPAGETRDLWYHAKGCGAWLVVHRNTLTHEVHSARLARDLAAGAASGDAGAAPRAPEAGA